MQTTVISVKKDAPVFHAIELLSKNNITGLPVIDDDMNVIGIITEKDVITLLYTVKDKNTPVEDFMTKDVVTFDHEDSMIDVTDCFAKNNFRRVPVLAEGKLVGILSKKDIIAYILKMRKTGEMELALQAIHRQQNW